MPTETANEAALDFLMLAQAAIGAMDFSRREDPPMAAGATMLLAINASKNIPENFSAFDAFIDFCNYRLSGRLKEAPSWLEPKVEFRSEDTEVFIDGVWQPENPRWVGLPFESKSTLEVAALLRDRQSIRMREFVEVFPHLSRAELRHSLQEIADEGLGELTGKGPSSVWVARGAIEAWQGSPEREHHQAKAQREFERVEARDKERAGERRKLLRHIEKSGGASMTEMAAVLPRARSYIIKRLKELAADGSIELVGSTRNAKWRPTPPN